MTLQVVGAGLGRTGTHSLKIALERLLGGTCHHMIEVFAHPDEVPVWHAAALGEMPNWQEFLAGYTAQVDWPGGSFYRELAEAFPDALVLLSVRDPDSWYRSASNTIFNALEPSDGAEDNPWLDMIMAIVSARFCTEVDNPDAMKKAFVAHNDEVRDTIPADRLLVWEASDGWAPICERLGVAVPDMPFPLTNTTNEFRNNMGLPPIA